MVLIDNLIISVLGELKLIAYAPADFFVVSFSRVESWRSS